MWKTRNLSIKGKITLLRSQALPLILFPCTVLFVPDEIEKEVSTIFYDFIWPNQKFHVKKNVLIQNIENGGLKMPDISSMIKAIKINWVKRLTVKNNSFTSVILKILSIFSFVKMILNT